MNATDLHIEFKLQTGQDFAYKTRQSTGKLEQKPYHTEDAYTKYYAEWLEKKYLELLLMVQEFDKLVNETNKQ